MKSHQHHIKSPLNPIKIPLNRMKSYEILLVCCLGGSPKSQAAKSTPPKRRRTRWTMTRRPPGALRGRTAGGTQEIQEVQRASEMVTSQPYLYGFINVG